MYYNTIKFFTSFIPNTEQRRKIRNKLLEVFKTKEKTYKINKMNKLYLKHIKRIKNKKGKIKVGFLVNENQKWNCQSLYDVLEKNDKYEPVILLTQLEQIHSHNEKNFSDILENYKFFEKKGLRIEFAYDIKRRKYISLKTFNCDIIFFPQPWALDKSQNVYNVAKYSLTAYVPYCFHMLEEENNYFDFFHMLLWMYFVESPIYEKKYEKEFDAKNVFFSGHTKLDNYLTIEDDKFQNNKKKIIIYAPHHFGSEIHHFITFEWNGEKILETAKKHPEYDWVFKPHPLFKNSMIKNNIMNEQETNSYFEQWAKIGTVYTQGDYYTLFKKSSVLITDCISFLAEYMPTENPVLFLKSENQIAPFTVLGEKITEHYYKMYNWQEFEDVFNRVVLNNDDYLKEERLQDLKYLFDKKKQSAAENIVSKISDILCK